MATYRRSIVWRLACDPAAYLWSGVGDLDLPANALDPGVIRYRGTGALLQVPALKQLINGIADRVDFTVSGVDAYTLRLALEDRASVKGASLDVGYVLFDRHWQLSGPPVWQWRGKADVLVPDSKETERGRERSITLSVAAADTLRTNPKLSWFTDANQRRRSPTDAIFDRVAGINGGATRRFGAR
jgi:hypothetical protein